MRFIKFALGLLCFAALPSLADVTALVAIEPTARKDGLILSRSGLEAALSKVLGQTVTVTITDNLSDAMRATRSGAYNIFIGPAQVAASSIAHGYELIGSTEAEEQYVLVGRSDIGSVAALRRQRLYLPQQDSIYTYMARGLLTANGLSFKDLARVDYARYPQAGLTAVSMRMAEATLIRRDDWEAWLKDNPSAAKQLAISGAVPGGFSVTMHKQLDPAVRGQLSKWFTNASASSGLRPVAQRSELARYQRVAELGTFTPTSLPGVTVVAAAEVSQLMSQGAVLVDTRSEKEFAQKHIPGAVLVPYHEKSLKDVAYDGRAGRLLCDEGLEHPHADDLPLQRGGVLEKLQGQPCRALRRIRQGLLVSRRHAGLGARQRADRRRGARSPLRSGRIYSLAPVLRMRTAVLRGTDGPMAAAESTKVCVASGSPGSAGAAVPTAGVSSLITRVYGASIWTSWP